MAFASRRFALPMGNFCDGHQATTGGVKDDAVLVFVHVLSLMFFKNSRSR
jgi:hypothetical protein